MTSCGHCIWVLPPGNIRQPELGHVGIRGFEPTISRLQVKPLKWGFYACHLAWAVDWSMRDDLRCSVIWDAVSSNGLLNNKTSDATLRWDIKTKFLGKTLLMNLSTVTLISTETLRFFKQFQGYVQRFPSMRFCTQPVPYKCHYRSPFPLHLFAQINGSSVWLQYTSQVPKHTNHISVSPPLCMACRVKNCY